MQNLGDIITSVKENKRPDYEDLRYAVLALAALSCFDSQALMKLSTAETEKKKPFLSYSAAFQYEEHFRRNKLAFAKRPKDWIGWNNDPENPEYQSRRAVSLKIFDKILEKTKDARQDNIEEKPASV